MRTRTVLALLLLATTANASSFGGGSLGGGLGGGVCPASGISGSGANTQVVIWTGASSVTGLADLTYDTSTGFLSVTKSLNGLMGIGSLNANAGGAASALNFVSNGTISSLFFQTGTGYTTSGLIVANQFVVQTNAATGAGALFDIGVGSFIITKGGATAANDRFRIGATETVLNEGGANQNSRVESDTQANALFLDSSLDGGFGRWGMFTASPTAKLHINAGTLVTTVNGLRVDATFPTGGATEQFASRVLAVGAGSTDTGQSAFFAALNPGYTGAGYTTAMIFANTSAGTGTTGGVFADPANYGVYGYAAGTTSGRNIGGRFTTEGSSSANFGAVMGAVIGSNSPALNVGGQAYARNATTNVGFYAGLNGSQPTLSVSAAFIADNSDQTSPIFLARDNGSTVFTLADAMTAVSFGTGLDRDASGTYAIGGTNITTLTLGRTGQAVAHAGTATFAEGITFADAVNITVNATTGTKFGTTTTGKLSVYNAAPVAQGAAIPDATGGAVQDAECRTAVNALLARERTFGQIAP